MESHEELEPLEWLLDSLIEDAQAGHRRPALLLRPFNEHPEEGPMIRTLLPHSPWPWQAEGLAHVLYCRLHGYPRHRALLVNLRGHLVLLGRN